MAIGTVQSIPVTNNNKKRQFRFNKKVVLKIVLKTSVTKFSSSSCSSIDGDDLDNQQEFIGLSTNVLFFQSVYLLFNI